MRHKQWAGAKDGHNHTQRCCTQHPWDVLLKEAIADFAWDEAQGSSGGAAEERSEPAIPRSLVLAPLVLGCSASQTA